VGLTACCFFCVLIAGYRGKINSDLVSECVLLKTLYFSVCIPKCGRCVTINPNSLFGGPS